jgi:tRNA A-37 threonylcarbamoyl transferase component Bud32
MHGGQTERVEQRLMFGHDNHRRIKSGISPALTVQSHASKVARVIQREHEGIRWELQPDFAPLLDELLKSSGETVKESPVKRVSRHVVGVKTFYVKRYLHHAVRWRPLKFIFKTTQARQEWELAQQLEARGISIVRHVGLGERQQAWGGVQESILVTEGFDGLPLVYAPGIDPLAVQRFVEQMHERGVLQEDLHPGNLLVRKEPFELRLVDLHGTRVLPALSRKQRDANLALLRVFLPIAVTPEVDRLSALRRRRLFYGRAARWARHNRDFVPARLGGLKWQVRSASLTGAVNRVLADPDGFLRARAEILKPGRSSTVGRADGLVLKRFNFRKLENLVKDLFRPSRARRAFRAAYHLELLGIPTARPIAAADRRIGGVLARSYFLMEEVPGATDLGKLLRGGWVPEPDTVKQAALLIAKLHNEGFSHRDLKESNLVLGTEGKLSILDLDGMQFFGEITRRRALLDLRRLARGVGAYPAVTARHRRLFWSTYCRAGRWGKMKL